MQGTPARQLLGVDRTNAEGLANGANDPRLCENSLDVTILQRFGWRIRCRVLSLAMTAARARCFPSDWMTMPNVEPQHGDADGRDRQKPPESMANGSAPRRPTRSGRLARRITDDMKVGGRPEAQTALDRPGQPAIKVARRLMSRPSRWSVDQHLCTLGRRVGAN